MISDLISLIQQVPRGMTRMSFLEDQAKANLVFALLNNGQLL
jgi:hypothetical protein